MPLPSKSTVADRPEPVWFGVEIGSCRACGRSYLTSEGCPCGLRKRGAGER